MNVELDDARVPRFVGAPVAFGTEDTLRKRVFVPRSPSSWTRVSRQVRSCSRKTEVLQKTRALRRVGREKVERAGDGLVGRALCRFRRTRGK